MQLSQNRMDIKTRKEAEREIIEALESYGVYVGSKEADHLVEKFDLGSLGIRKRKQ